MASNSTNLEHNDVYILKNLEQIVIKMTRNVCEMCGGLWLRQKWLNVYTLLQETTWHLTAYWRTHMQVRIP
jgi:hypothetical protein